jgi:hypothetical protein
MDSRLVKLTPTTPKLMDSDEDDLKKVTIAGKKYWLLKEPNKASRVYEVEEGDSFGLCLGRYNEASNSIDYRDCDEEEEQVPEPVKPKPKKEKVKKEVKKIEKKLKKEEPKPVKKKEEPKQLVEDEDIVKITVDGEKYWLIKESLELFEIGKNDSLGDYVGVYHPERDEIDYTSR